MPTPTQEVLRSFSVRARAALAALARELAGALAAGDEATAAHLVHKGQLLRQGLRSVTTPTNRLSEAERVYIVEKLLGLLPAPAVSLGVPPTLTLAALPARVRGRVDSAPLPLTGTVGGSLPAGAQVLISRDGRQIARQGVLPGRYQLTDPAPGWRYRVELLGTGLAVERARPLVSPVLVGTGRAGAAPTYLLGLPMASAPVTSVMRVSVVGTRDRILLAVPLSVGTVTALTQPDDQDADILMAFTRRRVTLDFGADGQDEYEVLENYADFLGPFTFDVHLALAAGSPSLPPTDPTPGEPNAQLTELQFEPQFE